MYYLVWFEIDMALFLEVKKSISKYSANMLLDHLNDNQGKINYGKFTHFKELKLKNNL